MRSINHLLSEIDAAYHEASLRLGLADSAMQILYILCSQGGACLLRNICRQSGTSKQTINSALLGIVLIRPIAAWLGAEGEMLDQCVLYGRIILPALPAYMLQYEFQSFFATAEKPQLGLGFTIAAGLTNMVLDAFFFVALLGWGLVGAAAATAIAGFHYGARNHPELQSLLRKSLVIIGRLSLLMFAFAEGLAEPLARLFVGYDPSLMALTLRGFMLYSFSFLFAGVAIFGSSFFTALNNGLISALISFLRTLLFQVGAVLIFPLLWGLTASGCPSLPPK